MISNDEVIVKVKAVDNANWVMEKFKNPSKWWHLRSTMQFGLVAICTKIFIEFLSKTTVHNKEILIKALDERPKGTPLITVANHHSCVDDPGLWGCLRLSQMVSKQVMRWGLAAQDFCFTEKSHAKFFLYGKGIPVERGGGVHQPAIDMCIEKLKLGDWVHVFPEGKVNETKEPIRLKWGVGRMIYELPQLPIVIPIWHMGMDELLSNTPPYILKPGKRITFNFGNPIDLSSTMAHVRESKLNEMEARKYITDKIQEVLYVLREQTLQLHQNEKT